MDDHRDAPVGEYLLDGERVVVAVRRHWVRIVEPVLTTVAGLVLALWVEASGPPGGSQIGWWLWFALIARLIWKLGEWRRTWFVATDKRLVLTYGIFTRKIAMMPLAKVTDMSFVRTVPGRVFGYGKFVLERAGQEQAQHKVNWIPDANRTYRAICAEIFGVDDRDRVLVPTTDGADSEWDDWDDGPEGPDAPGRGGGPGAPGGPRAPGSGHPDQSRELPVHQPVSETLYRSEDQQRRDRAADTGPVTYFPPEHL